MASSKKQKETTRKRVAAWRAKQKGKDNPQPPVTEIVTPPLPDTEVAKGSVVTKEEILNLPLSIRFRLDAVTRSRLALRQPDNLRERQERAVRNFRGY